MGRNIFKKFNRKKASEILDKSVDEAIKSNSNENFLKKVGRKLVPNILGAAVNFIPYGPLAKTVAGGAVHYISSKIDKNSSKYKEVTTKLARTQVQIHRSTNKEELTKIVKDYKKEISFL